MASKFKLERHKLTINMRPHYAVQSELFVCRDWCRENHSNFNCLISSLLPALAYALHNNVFFDEKTKQRFIRADFGDIPLREPWNVKERSAAKRYGSEILDDLDNVRI